MSSTTVLDSYDKKTSVESGFTVTSFMLSGSPHKAAIVKAVNEVYPRPTVDWASLITRKVTLLLGGENVVGANSINIEEATLYPSNSGGIAYLPKGKRTKGFKLNPDRVLDYVEGYNGQAELIRRVEEITAKLPRLTELTQERLNSLSGRGNTCTLAVFGHFRLDNPSEQALWLIHSYIKEDDIAEGVLIVPAFAGFSENGSSFGKDLLRVGGEIVGFQPVSFKEAISWTDWDHADVLAEVVRRSNS